MEGHGTARLEPARRGLADVVEERGEAQHDIRRGPRMADVLEGDRLAQHRQRMLVDVLVMVVLVDLESERGHLRQKLGHEARLDEQAHTGHGVGRLQQPDELPLDTLRTDDLDRRSQPLDRLDGGGIDREAQLRRESCGPQHPQRVVAEADVGIAGGPQHFTQQVLDSTRGVDELSLGNPQRHCVDGEVSAQEIRLEGIAEDDIGLAGHAVVAVGAVGRDLDLVAPDARTDRAELAADVPVRGDERAEDLEDVVGSGIRREVEVVRRAAQQRIAHRTAHDRELAARVGEGAPEGRHRRVLGEGAETRNPLRHVQHPPSLPTARVGLRMRQAQEAGADELTDPRKQVVAQRAWVNLEQLGDRRDEGPDREVAVARADERGERGIHLHGSAQRPALAQFDDGRIVRPRNEMARLGDIGRDGERGREEEVVVAQLGCILGGEEGRHVRAETVVADRMRQPLGPIQTRGRGLRGAAGENPAETQRLDSAHREVVQPRREHPFVIGGSRNEAPIAHPEAGVRDGIETLALEDPGIEPLGPRAHGVEAVLPRPVLPVAQHDRDARGREAVCEALDDLPHEGVAHTAPVAVLEHRHIVDAGRDDERRVRRDEVELLVSERLVETPEPRLDRGHAVQLRGELRERECARRDVGRDDAFRTPTGAQAENAAAAAEIERPLDASRGQESGERAARPANPQHVVGGKRAHARELVPIARDPPLLARLPLAERDGANDDEGLHGVTVDDDASGLDEGRNARAGKCPFHLGDGDGIRPPEQPCDHARGIVARARGAARGRRVAGVQGRDGRPSPRLGEMVLPVSGVGEVVAQVPDGSEGRRGKHHDPIQPACATRRVCGVRTGGEECPTVQSQQIVRASLARETASHDPDRRAGTRRADAMGRADRRPPRLRGADRPRAEFAATPSPSPSPTLSGSATLTLAPAANGVLSAGQTFAATVALDNGTASTVVPGAVTLLIGGSALPDRAALTAWLSGSAPLSAPATLGSAPLPPAVSGTSATAVVAVPADSPGLAGRAAGVYPLESTTVLGSGEQLSARSVLVVPPATPTGARAGVVVPVTAPPIETPLLTGDQLGTLTGPGGALSGILDAVEGTSAILAIDPAIPAAIRALGTRAPASATAWLTRLGALPNARFALQFGDADVSTQIGTGLSAPLAPTSLTGALSATDFVASAGIAPATPAPSATPAPATARAATTLPSLDDLLALNTSRDFVYWPPSGSATTDVVTRLAALGTSSVPSLTLVPSATTSVAAESAIPVRGSTGAAELLVFDSELSDALSRAAVEGDGVRRGAALATATAYGSLASSAGRPFLAALDRAAVEGSSVSTALHAAIAAVEGIPGTATATLGALANANTTPVTIDHAQLDAGRVDAARGLLAGADRLGRFATVLDDPSLLTGPERASILQLLSVGWIGTGASWTTALGAHRDRVTATLGAVSIVPPTPVNLLSAGSGVRVWLRNDLPYPVQVVLRAQSEDLRLEVQQATSVRVEASSNAPVEIPVVSRVGSGELTVRLSLASRTGEPVGNTTTVAVNVRADWEGIGIVVLALIVTLLLVLGVIRTIRRRRKRATDDAAPADAVDTPEQRS